MKTLDESPMLPGMLLSANPPWNYKPTILSARGTWRGAYNAVREYVSYSRGRSDDNRLNALWFGEAARINRDALTAALAMAI